MDVKTEMIDLLKKRADELYDKSKTDNTDDSWRCFGGADGYYEASKLIRDANNIYDGMKAIREKSSELNAKINEIEGEMYIYSRAKEQILNSTIREIERRIECK